MAKHILRVLLF